MARYDNRNVRRVGRPVYGRGDSAPAARRKSPRLKLQLPSKRLIKPFVWLIGLIILITVVGKMTAITSVTLSGASATNSSLIDKSVKEGLRKQWFGSNLIFVNTGNLKTYLLKAQPVVEEVTIKRKLPHVLTVTVIERKQGIRWKSNEQTYLLDTRGVVIGESSAIHDHLPLVGDSTNLPVKQGDRVVSRLFVTFTTSMSSGLPPLGYKIEDMTIPETSSELHIKTDKGYVLKFDTARPPGEALADLAKIRTFLDKDKKVPTEYIDLRIPGKAYYR